MIEAARPSPPPLPSGCFFRHFRRPRRQLSYLRPPPPPPPPCSSSSLRALESSQSESTELNLKPAWSVRRNLRGESGSAGWHAGRTDGRRAATLDRQPQRHGSRPRCSRSVVVSPPSLSRSPSHFPLPPTPVRPVAVRPSVSPLSLPSLLPVRSTVRPSVRRLRAAAAAPRIEIRQRRRRGDIDRLSLTLFLESG